MALTAINVDGVSQYVSPRDPGYQGWREGTPGNATIFSLRALSAGELGEILDSTQEVVARDDGTRGIRINVNQRCLRLVRSALLGWHNLLDERGATVRFELCSEGSGRAMVANHCLDALPRWLVRELAAYVLGENSLSEADAKNSGASSEAR